MTTMTTTMPRIQGIPSSCIMLDNTSNGALGSVSAFSRSSFKLTRSASTRFEISKSGPPRLLKFASSRCLKRRVTFGASKTLQPKVEVIEPLHYLYEEDIPSLWWSAEELNEIDREINTIANFYVSVRPDYVDAVVTLLKRCAQSEASELCLRTDDSIGVILNGPSARGLEPSIVQMMHTRRNQSIPAVLMGQKRLRNTPEDQRARLLALQYARTTRYAAVFARVMADGDVLCCADDV